MSVTSQKYKAQLLLALKRVSKDSKKLHDALTVLLTPTEYEEIAKRLEILKALTSERESQRSIAERVHVSIATVTRGSLEYQRNVKRVTELLSKI